MMCIDDRRKGGVRRAAGIEPRRSSRKRRDERLDVRLGDQRVIRGDAGLAGVGELAGGDARGGVLQRKTRRHDGWRFAAKFKGYRHEMIARRAHHGAADGRAAGEDQMIEGQRGKGRADLRAAAGDGDLLLGEGFAQHGGEKLGRFRREF